MDGGINRIERAGPQPAARVRRVDREPFTLDDVAPRDGGPDENGADDREAGRDDDERDERPIAPRGDDENGARIDLTA